jgi:hypothetical protein
MMGTRSLITSSVMGTTSNPCWWSTAGRLLLNSRGAFLEAAALPPPARVNEFWL